MSPEAIELALDSHEDELSRTAIDIGMLARRIEQLESMQVKILDLLHLVPNLDPQGALSPADLEKGRTAFNKMLAAIRAEIPKAESDNVLLTAEVRKPDAPPA